MKDPVDLANVQGDILKAYGLPVSAHLFVAVPGPAEGRELLADTAAQVTTAANWRLRPPVTLNVGLTYAGLEALGLPAELLASFPVAFRDGMASRSELLGDTERSAPSNWDADLVAGNSHLLFTINAVSAADLDSAVDDLTKRCRNRGATVVSDQRGARLPNRKEHFGYTDGIGQPAVEGTNDPVRGEGDLTILGHWRGLPVGEFFHGHIDGDGYPSPGPAGPFGFDGTFKVWRKLHEDVSTFRSWVVEQAEHVRLDPELVKAKLIGRWPDGSPLALAPDRPNAEIAADPTAYNDFDYTHDPRGDRCPLGAHIRRVNPRAGLGFGDALSERQRIIRRGMTYGPALPDGADDDGEDRGIYFVAYMADIERQFEFIQQHWCNTGDVIGVGHDRDPIVGRATGDHKFVIPGPVPKLLHPLPELVTTRGGEYLWVPSVSSLHRLAAGDFSVEPEPPGDSLATQLLGGVLGATLAPVAAVGSGLRGKRIVHPVGVGYRAEIVIFDPPLADLSGSAFGSPRTFESVIRLSRAFALPGQMRDVRGFALRLLDADRDGGVQDLLFATVESGRFGAAMNVRLGSYDGRYSTMVRLRAPRGLVLFTICPRQPMPTDAEMEAGSGGGLRFDLAAGPTFAEQRNIGIITLTEALTARAAEGLSFSLSNASGHLEGRGVVDKARVLVYRASHRARVLRNRAGDSGRP